MQFGCNKHSITFGEPRADDRVFWLYPSARHLMTKIKHTKTSDGEEIRVLQVNRSYQSATYLGEKKYDLVFDYHQVFADLLRLKAQGRVLVLGGGAYSFPKYALSRYPKVSVDVVEFDPCMTDIARKHFYLADLEEKLAKDPESRLAIFHEDAYQFVLKATGIYDLIFNDVFDGKKMPENLSSKAAIEAYAKLISKQGMYVINCIASLIGEHSEPLYKLIEKLSESFDFVYLQSLGEDDPRDPDNVVVVASHNKKSLLGFRCVACPLDDAEDMLELQR